MPKTLLPIVCICIAASVALPFLQRASSPASAPQEPLLSPPQKVAFAPAAVEKDNIAASDAERANVAAMRDEQATAVTTDTEQEGTAAFDKEHATVAVAEQEQSRVALDKQQAAAAPLEQRKASLAVIEQERDNAEQDSPSFEDHYPVPAATEPNFSYLAYYAYSEVPPDKKPADTVLEAFKDIPIGTAIEEIKRAADAFGLDSTFMEAVAKIESNFDPRQRTGSYIGLFQLSNYEFQKYGSGDITNPRDNAVAVAYKFATAGILFELNTHKKATLNDLYLIHQQGTQGAAEHISHPEWIAWKSMCATDEGREKGEKWCKRAIWLNTLPSVKQIWKSVDKLTSGAFVDMWRERVEKFYTRYSEAVTNR